MRRLTRRSSRGCPRNCRRVAAIAKCHWCQGPDLFGLLARTGKARASTAKPKVAQKPAAQKPAPSKKPAVDSDVAILAALLAHTKTPEAGSPEEIYKRCATNATAAEVQRCRVRVCQGSAKGAAECKSVRISKVSSSS